MEICEHNCPPQQQVHVHPAPWTPVANDLYTQETALQALGILSAAGDGIVVTVSSKTRSTATAVESKTMQQ